MAHATHRRMILPLLSGSEVLIRVKAAGLNPLDVLMRAGYARSIFPSRKQTLGRECSGVVAKVGSNVWNYKEGDEVIAVIPPWHGKGSFTDQVTVNESWIAPKPKNKTYEESACYPFAVMTVQGALQSISIPSSARSLVIGASGSVGCVATQTLVSYGSEVVGTASEGNAERVMEYGARKCIDHHSPDWILDLPDGHFDLIFDASSRDSRLDEQALLSKLAPNAHFVTLNTPLVKNLDEVGALGLLSSAVQLLKKKKTIQADANKQYHWGFFNPFSCGSSKASLCSKSEATSAKSTLSEAVHLIEDSKLALPAPHIFRMEEVEEVVGSLAENAEDITRSMPPGIPSASSKIVFVND